MAVTANSTPAPAAHGPVTRAIRAAEREHEPNRRSLLAGLLATPLLSAPASAGAPDPHPTMLPELFDLWREHRRTAFGWGQDAGSAESEAANEAHSALVDGCMAVAEMPAPRTLEGLSALGIALGLAFEGLATEDGDIVETGFGALVSAVLAATGAAMPDDWTSMTYRRLSA